MEDNIILKDDLVKMVQNAKRNSCVSETIPVYGEKYVSPKTNQRKEKDLKSGISTLIAASAVVATIVAGVKITDTMDFATEVRQEINDTYVDQNLIGGQYVEKNEHDQEFRDYVSDLNDFQLVGLFNDTSEQMQDNGMVNGTSNIQDVVDQMEENYLENTGRNK